MGFNKYPYTDLHEMNLDWIIARTKELIAKWAETSAAWLTQQEAFESLKNYVYTWFDNLDVQQEINHKIDALVEDGTLSELIAPYVASGLPAVVADQISAVVAAQISAVIADQLPSEVASQLPSIAATEAAAEVGTWLSTHIDPDTGYVIDDSLTVQGAAADAKATGDQITELKNAVLYDAVGNDAYAFVKGKYIAGPDGTEGSSTNYAHSNMLRKAGYDCLAISSADYEFYVSYYGANASYADGTGYFGYTGYYRNGQTAIVPNCVFYVITFRKIGGGTVSVDDVNAFVSSLTRKIGTDVSLSERLKEADAYAVGNVFTGIFKSFDDSRHFTAAGFMVNRDIDLFSGLVYDSDTRSRSTLFTAANFPPLFVMENSNIEFRVFGYHGGISTENYDGELTDGWTSVFCDSNSSPYILVVFRYKDGRTMTEDDAEVLSNGFRFYKVGDTTLKLSGKGADSAVVGEKIYTDFFRVDDDVAYVNYYDGVIDLYDELVTQYPNLITKYTLTSNSFTNYEYVITSGNYNAKNGRRNKDSEISKKVILITSGVHGNEQASVMGLYYFAKELLACNYLLKGVLDGVCIKIIPIVCPWGYDNYSRLNESGVNINRNFASSNWELTPEGQNYSGAAPGDQDETKVVQNWINANTNAVILIDWHNSAYKNEISCLLGYINDTNDHIKKLYLSAIDRVTPYWRRYRNIPDTDIYGYTGHGDTSGTTGSYANDKEIPSFTMETSIDVQSSGINSNFTIGVSCETIGNVIVGLKDLYKLN